MIDLLTIERLIPVLKLLALIIGNNIFAIIIDIAFKQVIQI